MKVTSPTLLLGGLCLLAVVLTERVAHAAAASRADQYDARHGTPPPPQQPRREATDQRRSRENVLELNANPDRNHDNDRTKLSLIADADAKNQDPVDDLDLDRDDDGEDSHSAHSHETEPGMGTNELGEMQVGCGHGLFEVVPAPKQVAQANKKAIRKRAIETMRDGRRKRNFHSTFTVWQPPMYQLTRPYVIPVWGAQGQQPIYFPPQPIPPPDDPRQSYLPPNGYLPPKRTTTIGYEDEDDEGISGAQGPEGNIPRLDTRIFDDAPIWDVEPPIQSRPPARPPVRTTPSPFVGSQGSQGQPTRTRRPGTRTTTAPSLIHRSESNNTNTNFNSNQRPNSLRPVQNRPNSVEVPNFRPQQGGGGGFFGGVPQPTWRPVFRPNTTPSLPPAQPSRAQPSRCVWAIISCCQGNNKNISYSCFEQLGCTGAFWDKSPCDSDFAKSAVDLALQYYSQK